VSSKVELKLDWCSHEAAKFACEHWHYSRCMPAGKLAKVGVWEDGKYIGVVLFGRGASPFLKDKYGLEQIECVELVRVALNKHSTSVSRILSIAFAILTKTMQGLRLIVSFADPEQGHIGGIYQAGNWVYTGDSLPTRMWLIKGKRMHERSVGAIYGTTIPSEIKKLYPDMRIEIAPGKHRYLMPLDKEMAKQIESLRKPYPKKPCAGSETVTRPAIQQGEGGSIPTPALNEASNAIP